MCIGKCGRKEYKTKSGRKGNDTNEMKHVKCKIYHKGCWGGELAKYPELCFRIVNWFPVKKTAEGLTFQGVFKASCSSQKLLKKYIKEIKNIRDVREAKLVNKTHNLVLINALQRTSTYDNILYQGSVILNPPVVKKGYEIYELLLLDEKVKQLLQELDSIGELKLIKKKEYSEEFITTRQKEALRLALSNDYYSWPRETNLEKLAKVMGISRSVYQEHLRKAEAKLFPGLLRGAETPNIGLANNKLFL